jgi:hypothetical protein
MPSWHDWLERMVLLKTIPIPIFRIATRTKTTLGHPGRDRP